MGFHIGAIEFEIHGAWISVLLMGYAMGSISMWLVQRYKKK